MGSLAMTCDAVVFNDARTLLDLALFIGIGLLGGLGHYLIIRAFPAWQVAVFGAARYVELVGTATLGYVIFGNFPDLPTWIGAGIIIASGLYIRAARAPAAASAVEPDTNPARV